MLPTRAEQLPEVLTAASYCIAAAALFWIVGGRKAAAAGMFRWIMLGALLAEAGIAGLMAMNGLYWPGAKAYDAPLAASVGQLVISLCLWPFLIALNARLRRTIGKHGRLRMERANAEAAQAYAWLEIAERAAMLGHWRLHSPSSVLEWSQAMYDLHGVPAAGFLPDAGTVALLFHPDDQSRIVEGFATPLGDGERRTIQARLRRPDTELRHVVLSAVGQPGGVILGIMADVTEQRQAEARMREANAVALQANAALKELTFEDGLTGLANRRQFDVSLVHEFKRAVRGNVALGLVLIDIDQFGAYNELYGHSAGDACLAELASAIKALPRRTGDVLARFSGDEIVLLLPLADGHGVVRVAKIIADTIRMLRIPHAGSETGFLTASCGTAAFTGLHDLNNPLDLVRRADQALYKAKSDGRDRVCAFEPGLANDLRDPYGPAVTHDIERIIKSRAV